jgi:hypothetical protein
MPRGKVQMVLIDHAVALTRSYNTRKKGLKKKKAHQLTILCDVDVARVVCAGHGGGGAPADV